MQKSDIELKINPEYESLVPPLTDDEYNELKASIVKHGKVYVPIVISKDNYILDGHNRYKIAKECGAYFDVSVMDFKDELDEKEFVIKINLERRHLNNFQKVELCEKLIEIEGLRAKNRQSEAGRIYGRGKENSSSSNDEKLLQDVGETRVKIAKAAGVSVPTAERAMKILKKGTQELKDKVRSGKTSISYAAKTLTRSEDHKQPPKLPQGSFDVIVADPPWEYDINTRGSPDEHYAVMKQKDIEELKIPSADKAILFLWATAPKLPEALKVMRAWGFTYKTNAVWIKDKIGTGYYFRGQHELLLVGNKGDITTPMESTRPSSVIEAPRLEHSQKPDVVYGLVEQMYPNRTYLELFARNERKGWKSWGNELPQ
jgi:N6-adenosine-specific RNA methylase IME4/ParB-like chromosome segregation protein Spo0J